MPKEILPEEVELQAQDLNPSDGVDIQMLQDGGAIVDFDPQAGAMQGAEIHTANLAEFLDEDDLTMLASEVLEAYDECASSRDEWEQSYKKGLDLLGLNTKTGQNHFKAHQVQHTLFLQKQSHSFKRKPTKNSCQQVVLLEHRS